MIPRETLEKIRKTIRRIEITTKKIVNETLAGQYHSVFKGRGMEFDSVREYVPGDDIRNIDWNVTARSSKPFTKQFTEERELTVVIAVDASASMNFGSFSEFKNEQAAMISALISFSAIKNNDRVGLVMFTDDVEKHLPPKKGKQHVLRLVRDVLFFSPRSRKSRLDEAIKFIRRTQKRKSVVFLISDFLDHGWEQSLNLLKRKHDVIAMQLIDPLEKSFSSAGLIEIIDPESGDIATIDTANRRWRQQYETSCRSRQVKLEKHFKSNGIDFLSLATNEAYDEQLVRFFRKRALGAR